LSKASAPSLTWLCGFDARCLDCGYMVPPSGGQREGLRRLAEHGLAHAHRRLHVTVPVHVPGLHGPDGLGATDLDVREGVRQAATAAAARLVAEEAERDAKWHAQRLLRDAGGILVPERPMRPQCAYESRCPPASLYVCGHVHCSACSAHVVYSDHVPHATCRCAAGFETSHGEAPAVVPLSAATAHAGRGRQVNLFGLDTENEARAFAAGEEE